MEQYIEAEFTPRAFRMQLLVDEWLIRDYGRYSVARLENTTFVVVFQDEAEWALYAYHDFQEFAFDAEVFQPPNSLVRALALELGITHVEDPMVHKTVEIASYFASAELDDLAGIEYVPRSK